MPLERLPQEPLLGLAAPRSVFSVEDPFFELVPCLSKSLAQWKHVWLRRSTGSNTIRLTCVELVPNWVGISG